MKKEDYEKLLTIAMSTGADFAEIYYEDSYSKSYSFNDSKLDTVNTSNKRGIGIRIIKDEDYYYASTNNLNMESLEDVATRLSKNVKDTLKVKDVKLNDLEKKILNVKIPHNKFGSEEKKKLLSEVDSEIRNRYTEVTQVNLAFIENSRNFVIANSTGKYIESNDYHTRYICIIYTERNDIKEKELVHYGSSEGYEFLNNYDIKKESLKGAKVAVEKLDAEDFKGGELPVIIAPGFGAVIFHEACGHGLEATTVANNLSIFSNLKGQKIGSDKVTIIDDGTISNCWGSNLIDDEGNKTEKTILIENGILKEYLVDEYASKKMNCKANGCGRRQDYNYAPTSRMSNTYLAPGTDKIEDMLKDIKLGVYCVNLTGGSVDPSTGDFNFSVDTAYLIENGKITKRIRGVTLIGNGKDILNNVEMVGDDLVLSDGYCGSKSGMVPVTIGQPTIKISKILVGGKE